MCIRDSLKREFEVIKSIEFVNKHKRRLLKLGEPEIKQHKGEGTRRTQGLATPEEYAVLEQYTMALFKRGTETVSYTHLDVYKRQQLLYIKKRICNWLLIKRQNKLVS